VLPSVRAPAVSSSSPFPACAALDEGSGGHLAVVGHQPVADGYRRRRRLGSAREAVDERGEVRNEPGGLFPMRAVADAWVDDEFSVGDRVDELILHLA
jgi:hypothetical protein